MSSGSSRNWRLHGSMVPLVECLQHQVRCWDWLIPLIGRPKIMGSAHSTDLRDEKV